MALQNGIIEILDEAQTSTVHHPKLLKSLKSLHDEADLVQFFEAFIQPLCAALVIVKKQPVVERVLEFVAKFSASIAPLDPSPREDDEKNESGDCQEEGGEGCDKEESDREEEEEEDEIAEHTFFDLLLAKLLSFHTASSRAVRFRSCQLVSMMINCAVERQCHLKSALLEEVERVMLERIHDKIPVVRVHAVKALELLQDPESTVQAALVKLLKSDPSPDVRKTVLSVIAITDDALPAIISRTRDLKDQIRKDAFWLLSERCNIRNFRIEQRIKLLNDGLNDRSEMVRDACLNGLLHSWCQNLDGDFLALLSRLDVESSPEVAELVLSHLFAQIEVGLVAESVVGLMDPTNRMETWDEEEDRVEMPVMEKVIPYDLLNSEEAFYWSCVCRYLHSMGDKGDEYIEKVVPTVSELCEYVQCYVEKILLPAEEVVEKMQKQFICQQLLSFFSVVDLSDEVGKQRLAKLVLDLLVLPGLPTSLVSPLLAQQTVLWPKPQQRVEKLLEVISDLRLAPLASTGVQPQSQSTTLTSEDSQMMANLSLLDIRSDPDTLSKCLAIASEMLKELRLRRLPVNLKTMVDALLLPSIQNELPDIRDMALNCLGLACLLDISLARNHLLLFLQVSQVDHESVQATALKVVFDLLHVFGFETFNITSHTGTSTKTPDKDVNETLVEEKKSEEDPEKSQTSSDVEGDSEGEDGEKDSDKTTQRILTIMADFIDGESFVLRGIAAEGLAKLLLSGRILSQKLLAKLLVLWIDPSTQEEDRLRAVLGLFFPAFASSDRSCRVMLGDVFIPVLETVSEAPPTSPLRDANLTQIADFLVHLSAPQEPNEDSVHDSLAIAVANAVLSEPDNSLLARVYCRSLTHMQLTASNQSNAAGLLVLLGHLEEQVPDKRSLQYIKKFREKLKQISPSSGAREQEGKGDGEGGGGGEEGEGERGGGEGDRDTTLLATKSAEQENVAKENKGGETSQVAGDDNDCVHAPDDTLLAAPRPPPSPVPSKAARKTSKNTKTKAKAASTTSKKAAPVQMKKKKKRITFQESESSSDSSNEAVVMEPQQLSSLPSRVRSSRAAKTSARKLISDSILATPQGRGDGEESDDSLVGDHSPFVRQAAKRSSGPRIPMLDYDDDD